MTQSLNAQACTQNKVYYGSYNSYLIGVKYINTYEVNVMYELIHFNNGSLSSVRAGKSTTRL